MKQRDITTLVLLLLLCRATCAPLDSAFPFIGRSWANASTDNATRTTPRAPRIHVSFINGIYHSDEDWRRITANLSRLFGCEVRAFYNPSSGYWIKDATKAGYELIRRPADTDTVVQLADHFRSMLSEAGPNDRILHLAHSGGAIITYLCAKHHLLRNETDRIDVTTFGGGRSITRKYFSGRIVNYYARNDPLLYVDMRANSLLRKAANESFNEVVYTKHNTSFVFIEGKSNNPVLDHSMEGDTYLAALEREALLRTRREYLMYFEQAIYPKQLIRNLRKLAANVTGQHHFFSRGLSLRSSMPSWSGMPSGGLFSNGSIRAIRKAAAKITGQRFFFSGNHRAQMVIIAFGK